MEKVVSKQEWIAVASGVLPTEGDYVLHTYAGVRVPEYGIFKNGRFQGDNGPTNYLTSHWLPVPYIMLAQVADAQETVANV